MNAVVPCQGNAVASKPITDYLLSDFSVALKIIAQCPPAYDEAACTALSDCAYDAEKECGPSETYLYAQVGGGDFYGCGCHTPSESWVPLASYVLLHLLSLNSFNALFAVRQISPTLFDPCLQC